MVKWFLTREQVIAYLQFLKGIRELQERLLHVQISKGLEEMEICLLEEDKDFYTKALQNANFVRAFFLRRNLKLTQEFIDKGKTKIRILEEEEKSLKSYVDFAIKGFLNYLENSRAPHASE
ncbi:MAG: hypothetical protein ACLU84_02650 [Clostridia bacterium]